MVEGDKNPTIRKIAGLVMERGSWRSGTHQGRGQDETGVDKEEKDLKLGTNIREKDHGESRERIQ